MAVKNDRVRVYFLQDTGVDGEVNMRYVRQPGDGNSDDAFWAGLAYIAGREKMVGAQGEHVVIYDVVADENFPVENTSDAIITRMPDETQRLKVHSVGHLRSTGEKIARCSDVSDADYTLTDN